MRGQLLGRHLVPLPGLMRAPGLVPPAAGAERRRHRHQPAAGDGQHRPAGHVELVGHPARLVDREQRHGRVAPDRALLARQADDPRAVRQPQRERRLLGQPRRPRPGRAGPWPCGTARRDWRSVGESIRHRLSGLVERRVDVQQRHGGLLADWRLALSSIRGAPERSTSPLPGVRRPGRSARPAAPGRARSPGRAAITHGGPPGQPDGPPRPSGPPG